MKPYIVFFSFMATLFLISSCLDEHYRNKSYCIQGYVFAGSPRVQLVDDNGHGIKCEKE